MEELGSQSDNLLLDEQQKGLYIILLYTERTLHSLVYQCKMTP